MPTYSTAMTEIQSRIRSQIDSGGGGSYFVLYDNDGNDDNIPDTTDATVWIRATFRLASSVQVEKCANGGNHRQPGLLIFQVFAKVGAGLAVSDAAVEAIVTAFRNYTTASGVHFRSVTPRPVGRDGALFQTNIECAFYYDSI